MLFDKSCYYICNKQPIKIYFW